MQCDLLCVASLSWHNIFKVYPCCNMEHDLGVFVVPIISHCMDVFYYFIIHSSVGGHLGCFHFLETIKHNATVNIIVQVFV